MAPPPKWGSEFVVNSAVSGDQESPSITSLANGGFVAVWMDSPNAGASFIYAQIFNADGSKVGAELLVDTTTDFHQIEPAAAALPNGGFVVTWADNPYNSQFDIAGQVFNFDGTKSGGVFHTYIPTIFDDREPVITALSDEHFVIAWNANGEVDAQIFKPDGASSTGRFALGPVVPG